MTDPRATAPYTQSLRRRSRCRRPCIARIVGSKVVCHLFWQETIRLKRGQGRREAVAAHDLRHFRAVRGPTRRRVHHLGRLAKILRTQRGRRDDAERLHVLAAVVVESVNSTARNTERLSRPDVDRCPVNSPGQHTGDAVNRLLVMVVAVRGSRQVLRGRNRELKRGDAAS